MPNSIQAGQLGHYTWIIDEIMIEEAKSPIPREHPGNFIELLYQTYNSTVDDFTQYLHLYLPSNYTTNEVNNMIIALHGSGNWDNPGNQERWSTYGKYYAAKGYIVAYPQYRASDLNFQQTDIASVISYLKDIPTYNLDSRDSKVGTIGGSAGNPPCIRLLQNTTYNSQISAHVSLYGSFPAPPNAIYDAANLDAMLTTTPILMQVGADDTTFLNKNIYFKNELTTENPGVPVTLTTYPNQGHGFFFDNNQQARKAQEDQLQFWNDNLLSPVTNKASSYQKPFAKVTNDHGIQISALTNNVAEDLIGLLGFLVGLNFNVPNMPSKSHLQLGKTTNVKNKKNFQRLKSTQTTLQNSEYIAKFYRGAPPFVPEPED